MHIKKCRSCGKTFETKKNYQIYCSESCYYESLKGKKRSWIKLKCEKCGKTFEVMKHLKYRKYCSKECSYSMPTRKPTYGRCKKCGKKFKKDRLKRKYCSMECKNKFFKGKNHPSWNGGLSSKYDRLMQTKNWKKWRIGVFERDNYTCQHCGFRSGNGEHRDLHAHHIKSANKYPKLVFVLTNGITLCNKCHGRVHSINFKNKVYRYN